MFHSAYLQKKIALCLRLVWAIVFLAGFCNIAKACEGSCCSKMPAKKECCCVQTLPQVQDSTTDACPLSDCPCVDFSSHTFAIMTNIYFLLDLSKYNFFIEVKHNLLYQKFFPDAYLSNLWHPPIAA